VKDRYLSGEGGKTEHLLKLFLLFDGNKMHIALENWIRQSCNSTWK